MDFSTVVQAVSAVGFPIVFCLILYKTMLDQNKQHKEESDKLTEAIHNNTIALTKLVDKLDKEDHDKG